MVKQTFGEWCNGEEHPSRVSQEHTCKVSRAAAMVLPLAMDTENILVHFYHLNITDHHHLYITF